MALNRHLSSTSVDTDDQQDYRAFLLPDVCVCVGVGESDISDETSTLPFI